MTVSLYVGGKIYQGWTQVAIVRSIETIAGGFDLSLTEKWDDDAVRWPIKTGDECTVKIDDDIVITGYVDDVNPSYNATDHQITVSGRDKTGDLVDCSAINKPDEWSNLSLEAIATKLASPFGISVKVADSTGKAFNTFKLQQGETAFEAIDRMCKMRAILPISDGKGGIVFTRAGSTKATEALIEGQNILAASGQFSWKDRFSTYQIKGQSPLEDGMTTTDAAHVTGSATDKGINRYRPLIIIAENSADGVSAKDRARWEASVRAARSSKYNVTVQGWRMANGDLWQINSLVRVTSPLLDLDDTLLIVDTRFTLDDQGSRTEMTLCRPDAYKLLPEVAKGKKGSASGLPANAEYIK